MDRTKSSSSVSIKNNTNNNNNNSTSKDNTNNDKKNSNNQDEEDDEMKFLKKVHRWDKMMRNSSFTWDETPTHRVTLVQSAMKGEQLSKQVKKDSVNLTEIESINSLAGKDH